MAPQRKSTVCQGALLLAACWWSLPAFLGPAQTPARARRPLWLAEAALQTQATAGDRAAVGSGVAVLVLGAIVAATPSARARHWVGRAARQAALADAPGIDDLDTFCTSAPERKKAAVYAVFGTDGEARYVGVARDVHGAISKHLATQPAGDCARVAFEVFERPSRNTMAAVQEQWIQELGSVPIGNSAGDAEVSWANPPLSAEEAERKLKLRQASADSSLQEEDPDAWSAVVQKAMKDGDFDGSEADALDAQIDADAEATARSALKRAAGDWKSEIEAQTAETIRGAQGGGRRQDGALEMYFAHGCPHCDRMRGYLQELGARWVEYDVEADETDRVGGEVTRRARHARINTVPQLYVLREPPLRGKQPERLIGGADDLQLEISSEKFQADLFG